MIKKIIKRLFSVKPITLFFPQKSLACVVFQLYSVCRKIFENQLKIDSSNYLPQLKPYFNEKNHIYPNEKMLLFAHSSNNLEYFIIQGEENSILVDSNWFLNYFDSKNIFLYAHVCNGSLVLRKEKWLNIFPIWISYNKDIWQYLGNKNAIDANYRLIKKIYTIICDESDLVKIKDLIMQAYNDIISDLYDNYDRKNLDVISMINLINARDSIEIINTLK